MLRAFASAAMVALALPTLAVAEEPHHLGPGAPHPAAPHPCGPPHPGPPPGPHPAFKPAPHAPMGVPPHGPVGGPPHPPGPPVGFAHPGGPPPGGPHFSFHGHDFNRVHVHPFIYPHGWEYRQWAVGAILPPLFLTPDYYYPEWAALGLEPPPPGTQWVRYGPDLLLVDVNTGQVIDVAYGVFYDE